MRCWYKVSPLFISPDSPTKGEMVLINAAWGVGSILVQLAKRAGAKFIIAGACTAEKLAFARSLGADYTPSGRVETLRAVAGETGPNIIYESVGGPVTAGSLAAQAPLGQLVVYGALNIQSFQIGVSELLGLIFKNQSLTGFALAPLLARESQKAGLARSLISLRAGN